MRKFTVFTVILSIVVVSIVAKLIVQEYIPKIDEYVGENSLASVVNSDQGSTDGSIQKLGFDLKKDTPVNTVEPVATDVATDMETVDIQDANTATIEDQDIVPATDELIPINIDDTKITVPARTTTIDSPSVTPDEAVDDSVAKDFEDTNSVVFSTNGVIRDEQIKSAGFVGAYLEDEKDNGFLYKTIYTGDLKDLDVKKYVIRTKTSFLAKIYVLKAGPGSTIEDVYKVIKTRAAEGLDTEINETNDFGENSFYMNDSRRGNTAFLTLKMRGLIFGFSYPKEYHTQIKNLISLLQMEK